MAEYKEWTMTTNRPTGQCLQHKRGDMLQLLGPKDSNFCNRS